MQLIPAIDIYRGECVRLLQGDFDSATTYDNNPLAPAIRYAGLGVPLLHLVDLDGARRGAPVNTRLIRHIAELMPVQVGGGLRSVSDVDAMRAHGAQRVVIGSIAVTSPALTRRLIAAHGATRIVLALDVRARDEQYNVSTHGWTTNSQYSLAQVMERYLDDGLQHVLITDIGRDGAMTGPNLELYGAMVRDYPSVSVQASGGIRDAADLRALADTGVSAAICGRALLEGRIDVTEMEPFLQSA